MSDKFPSLEDKASYAIGRQVGEQLLEHPFREMNFNALIEGLSDRVEDAPEQITEQDQAEALNEIGQRLQKEQEEQMAAQAQVNIEEGQKFLTENAQRPEVQVTDSGLQYEVLQEGKGQSPGPDSQAKVHYHGMLLDGTVFDSSVDRNEPIDLPVSGVIPGWTEALQMMSEGAKWKLYVPQDLAYGAQGAGNAIAPYSTLVFEIQLLRVLGD